MSAAVGEGLGLPLLDLLGERVTLEIGLAPLDDDPGHVVG